MSILNRWIFQGVSMSLSVHDAILFVQWHNCLDGLDEDVFKRLLALNLVVPTDHRDEPPALTPLGSQFIRSFRADVLFAYNPDMGRTEKKDSEQ